MQQSPYADNQLPLLCRVRYASGGSHAPGLKNCVLQLTIYIDSFLLRWFSCSRTRLCSPAYLDSFLLRWFSCSRNRTVFSSLPGEFLTQVVLMLPGPELCSLAYLESFLLRWFSCFRTRTVFSSLPRQLLPQLVLMLQDQNCVLQLT